MPVAISRRRLLQLLAVAPLLKLEWSHAPRNSLAHATGLQVPRKNVLVVVFDTLSARHMSLYGYRRETTPNLARFAERATVYHRHYAGGNFTTPGTASLLTGSYPWSHRAFNMRGQVVDSYRSQNLFAALSAQGYHCVAYTHSSLASLLLNQFHGSIEQLKPIEELFLIDEVFADWLFPKDVNTATWSEQLIVPKDGRLPTSLFISLLDQISGSWHRQRLEQVYGDLFPRGLPNADNEARFFVLEQAIDWLISELRRPLPQPFCVYCHLLPPHEPYRPRREFTEFFDDGWFTAQKPPFAFGEGLGQGSLNQRRLAYDQYLAYADAEFGRLYAALEQSNALETTIVVFTSDHGQMFERGIHGHITQTLYDPVIHIPLMIADPGQRQREDVYTPTSAVDVLPTLLALTGQPPAVWAEGQVLPPFGGPPADARSLFAVEAKSSFWRRQLTRATIAMIKDRYKLVYYLGYDGAYHDAYELFDLEGDPEELEDRFTQDRATAQALREELVAKLGAVNAPFL